MSVYVESKAWVLDSSDTTTIFEVGVRFSRDPVGEIGGRNLYHFVENNPVNEWDYNGLLIGRIVGTVLTAMGLNIVTSPKDVISMLTNLPNDPISGIVAPTQMGDATIKYKKVYEYTPYELKKRLTAPPFKDKSFAEVQSELKGCDKGMKKMEVQLDPKFVYGEGFSPITKEANKMGLQPVTPNPFYDPNELQLVPTNPMEYRPEPAPPEFITKYNVGSIIETGNGTSKQIGKVDALYKLTKTYKKAYL